MCRWCSQYGRSNLMGIRAWLVSMTMLAACAYPPPETICGGQRCRSGQICAANQDACIDVGGCGDGVVDSGKAEVCDDGNVRDDDGCSANCSSDETCGNGIIDKNIKIPESCDDGNKQSGDGCSADCQLENVCGNRITEINIGEKCDNGSSDTTSCNGNMAGPASCQPSACGDGYINAAANEQCDTSGGADTATCNGSGANPASVRCHLVVCGDMYVNLVAGEDCDRGTADTSTCNGNTAGLASCQIPTCGDGYVNTAAGEECDPNGLGCSGSRVCTSSCKCI